MSDNRQLHLQGFPLPILGVVARSGTGKTTLLERLIPALQQHGLTVGAVKHSHHDFEIDVPGKDSHRLRQAGARQVVLGSAHRVFSVQEGDGEKAPSLRRLLSRLDVKSIDLVLAEGFRQERFPKVEVFRAGIGDAPLVTTDDSIFAVLSDDDVSDFIPDDCLHFPLSDVGVFADYIVARLRQRDSNDWGN